MYDVFSSKFAQDIYLQKYSMNNQEKWEDTCKRVVDSVCNQLVDSKTKEKIFKLMLDRKFIPGGRYLYSAGRAFHQVNNCHSGSTKIITRNGIFKLEDLVEEKIEVINRFGKWEQATVLQFEDQEMFRLHFEDGRTVDATANHRWWTESGKRVTTMEVESVPYSKPTFDMEMDDEGIRHGIVFGDGSLDTKSKSYSYVVLVPEHKRELSSFFVNETKEITVGFGAKIKVETIRDIKAGKKISLQPKSYKEIPEGYVSHSYARGFIAGLIATDGSTKTSDVTISCNGYDTALKIADLAVLGGCVVTNVKVVDTVNPYNGSSRELAQVTIWRDTAPLIRKDQIEDVRNNPVSRRVKHSLKLEKIEKLDVQKTYCVVAPESESFTLSTGLITSNCFLFRAEDSREGWADATYKATSALMTGGGIGFDYSALRGEGTSIKRTGGTSTGPLALMSIINETGRYVMQGGQRRSAIYGSLHWKHSDVFKFMNCKNHSEDLKAMKQKDFNFPLPFELTNISVNYDTSFFVAMEDELHPDHEHAKKVFFQNCKQAFSTAEPGFSFNYLKDTETLRNACTEVTSEDDSDKCNLGTLWINRFKDRKEFTEAVKYATIFLMCGGIYSDVPNDKIREVGVKNNRIGLGLGGIHEWLMVNGGVYACTPELHKWLRAYEQESDSAAFIYAKQLNVSVPKGVRAIAPTGTIGIIAETTTGIEPLFCKAYKRRYYKDGQWLHQYVVDGSVKRLVGKGVAVENIQDSYDLSFQERVKFQADVQNYVDMAISSTCNLPQWGTEENNEKSLEKNIKILLKYAKRLRGFTCYPDACRGGQPLTRVTLEEALSKEGTVFEEKETECVGGVCGI